MAHPLRTVVRERAHACCEYCRMPDGLYDTPFAVDHIIARKHGGADELDNLARAYFHCNLRKGPNIAGRESTTRQLVTMFHPRQDRWNEHFVWDGPHLRGLTNVGRVTIDVLAINDPEIISVRASLIEEHRFPPLFH